MIRRLLRYLLPYRGMLIVAILSMAVHAGATALYPGLLDVLTTKLVGETTEIPTINRVAGLLGIDASALRVRLVGDIIGIFAIVVTVKAIAQALRFFTMGAIAQRVIRDLRQQLFESILGQGGRFYADQSTGHLVSKLVNDVAQVERAATYAIPVMIGDVLRVAALAVVCFVQYPRLSVISAVVLPAAVLPIVYFGKMLKRYGKRSQEALGGLTNRITETLGGMAVVQTYGREEHESVRFARDSDHYLSTMMKSVFVRAVQTPLMELIGVGALLLTLAYALGAVSEGAIRPGQVLGFMVALALMYEPIKALGRLNAVVMPGLAAAERVFGVVDHPPEVTDEVGARTLEEAPQRIRFENVTFRYAEDAEPALSDVSLELAQGEMVALVGPSGGGKSTIARLLPRLYDVDEGRITIDGTDIRDFTFESLRGKIAMVSQETYLFNDSVRANIAYGRLDATDDEIVAAAKQAFAHDFITQMEGAYDAPCGERGAQLSGGQRQRIAIARAFLRDAPILILDEATSALDTESERIVQKALEALMQRRTTLVIAHRLSTIRQADRIVVLEHGRVVEAGSHDTLATEGGSYQRLLGA